ncbi:NAD(P)/FAD-dependent oxidoreductase [Aquincola sp. MAHUQ-54]|uniref:NAD(P)/FAD-dependent oxidoreductase n=1 Tax=Aquincola agrisoli TaxID=3119538 RepID=A0AAW9QM01_9BURK
MTTPQRVLVVGGGIAGLLLATRLGEQLGRSGQAEVALIDRSATYVWKPMLHTIAAGTWDVHQQQVSYIEHARRHGFSYQPGVPCGLDRQARELTLAPLLMPEGEVLLEQRSLRYDALVLAIGSRANDFGTPGVAEHCHFIDSQAQAEAFNAQLRGRVLRSVVHREPLRIAIVGGGATGVELCAELRNLLDIAAGYGDPTVRERVHVTLLESGPRILPAFPEAVSASSAGQLRRLGIELHVDTRVTGAEAGGFRLGDGRLIEADMLVWAAGVKADDFLATAGGLSVNRTNQVVIGPSLHSVDDPRIFALGDCASLVPTEGAQPLPPTAQVANQQAHHLARHLGPWLAEGRAVPAFRFRDRGALVSLSQYNAFGTLGKFGFFEGGFIQGRFAQMSHVLLYRQHQIGLHGVLRAAAMWAAERLNGWVRPKIRLS